MNRIYVVAVYERWREYGGPEEGGWYYTAGELVDLDAAFSTRWAAYERAGYMNDDFRVRYPDESPSSRALSDVTQKPLDYYRDWTSTPRRYGSYLRADVVVLGELVLRPEFAEQSCHRYGDYYDADGEPYPEFSMTRLAVPEYEPETRPHYC